MKNHHYRSKNKILSLAFLFLLISTLSLNLTLNHNAYAARKKLKPVQKAAAYIPVEVIDSLKISDLDGAIRNIRMEATSPRSKYLLREMQRIETFEQGGKKSSKDHRYLFNVGVAYHNLYLFLKGYEIENEDFFKKALKYYKMAYRTKSPSRKNNINLTMAALYASAGDTKRAKKLFGKIDKDCFQDQFRKFEGLALYYSAVGDVENAIPNLESAYSLNPEHTKFWLGISDDFNQICDDQRFQSLLKKWAVKPLDRGHSTYSPKTKELVH